LNKGSFS
jgi:hypothetical protein